MPEIPFHQTVMGKRYYEHTLPKLIELLERIAVALERKE
jgi:hypothetical protein